MGNVDMVTQVELTVYLKRGLVPIQVLSSGRRDYENYIARTHEKFRSFRDSTIDKWSKKTKIASGKITSKVKLLTDSPYNVIYHVL